MNADCISTLLHFRADMLRIAMALEDLSDEIVGKRAARYRGKVNALAQTIRLKVSSPELVKACER